MRKRAPRLAAAIFVFALVWAAALPSPARAETFSAAANDHRTYLYFQVPEATVRRVLPSGWQPAPPPSGPAQGATSSSSCSTR